MNLIIVIIALICILVITVLFTVDICEGFSSRSGNFTYKYSGKNDPIFLGGKTKCFDCEREAIAMGLPTYLAQPTRCFDCEKQMVDMYGDRYGHLAQPTKCFDCEKQMIDIDIDV
jgi:hypothetical protein